MSGELDLAKLLATLEPKLRPGEFVFVTLPDDDASAAHKAAALGSFVEAEGLTLADLHLFAVLILEWANDLADGPANREPTGKVVTVEVNEGDEVVEGQVILILEAMKMQNEIQAPVSGTVVSVQCEEGQAIEANIPLVVIQPVAEPDSE